jgi:hypothetical protein
MDMKRWIACSSAALIAACATAPAPAPAPAPAAQPAPAAVTETPASALEDHAGDSVETAIAVPADAPDEGFRFQNMWMYRRFGTFRRLGGGTGTMNGRRYDVVDIELKNGEKHKVFFDITDNWNRWNPPAQPPK